MGYLSTDVVINILRNQGYVTPYPLLESAEMDLLYTLYVRYKVRTKLKSLILAPNYGTLSISVTLRNRLTNLSKQSS
jgi:hypothetical protein